MVPIKISHYITQYLQKLNTLVFYLLLSTLSIFDINYDWCPYFAMYFSHIILIIICINDDINTCFKYYHFNYLYSNGYLSHYLIFCYFIIYYNILYMSD